MSKKTGWGHPGLAMRVFVAASLLFALSGCQDDTPTPPTTAACTGSACNANPDPETPAPVTPLCPAALDYGTTFTGASAGGEYIKLSIDTATRRYRMTFVESSVPRSTGQLQNTRAGLTIEGDFTHPATLPTAEQNRCAIVLQSGQTSDGSYSATINPANPPMLFVGFGVVTGGSPGATFQFDGIELAPGTVIAAVPKRSFDSFPFIGFAVTETDLSQVAGRYHVVGMYLTPSGSSYQTAAPQGWEPEPVNWTETLNASGSCAAEGNGNSCRTTGTPWARRRNADGSQDNAFASSSVSAGVPYVTVGNAQPIVLLQPSLAHGIMIVGKVGNQRIPVVARIGFVNHPPGNLLTSVVDDQVGLSLLVPATAVQANAFDGKYVAVSSAALCGKVANNGPSGSPAVAMGVFDPSVDHPDLPGVYSGSLFHPDAGNCLDGSSTSTPAATYVGNLLHGADGVQAGATVSSATPSLSLDYAQTVPGKVKVSALQAFSTQGPSGNIPLFNVGDMGVMVRNGPVYALIMNSNKYNPFVQFGMALP